MMMGQLKGISGQQYGERPQTPQHSGSVKMTRRSFLATPVLLASRADAQQPFPARPIRLLVGSASAGSLDFVGRLIANGMAEILGQPVVVENRGGAQGALAMEPVLRAAPDGHTLVINNMGALLVNPLVQNTPNEQQPLEILEPIALVADVLTVLVTSKDRPWRSLSDLLSAARANPGGLSWGHPGVGSSPWLAALLLSQMADIRAIGVPYRGGGPAMVDLLAGRLDFMFATTPTCFPHIQTGALRAMGVPLLSRMPHLPDVPTLAEGGVSGFEVRSWFGVMTTKGTPRSVVESLNAAIKQTLAQPGAIAQLDSQGIAPLYTTPEEFSRIGKADREKWRPIAQLANRASQ
jgi:tripartite-type tricarboxylate transporter receptor subunit TctC